MRWSLLLLLLLLFCAGCSTMKDVGVGMRAGGGFGGVGLLGSIIEAAADLGGEGESSTNNFNAKQAADKKQKDAIFDVVVGDFIAHIKSAEKNNTLKPIKEEAEIFCSNMERQIKAREYSLQVQKEESSAVSYSVVTLSEDPFEGDCEKVLTRRGKVALASSTPQEKAD